jgi:rod shape-determining protein MreC
VAFGTPGSSRSQVRVPALGFRFTLYAIISIVVMFLDQRHGYLEQVRFLLQTAAYPLQLAVSSPSTAWHWMSDNFESREALQAENTKLKKQQHELELRTLRYEALARENGELRGLRDALPPVADKWLAAEIVNVQENSLRQRILINRGTTNGAFKAQSVLDNKGIIGQITHVGLFSAEVILITDPEHAIPVELERTGLRTIAVGAGDGVALALPYLPGNADVKAGDMLVSSGLGGVFPAGYPVAKVTEVHRDAVQPLAQVKAIPFATIDTDSEVMLVWFREDDPASPTAVTTGDLKVGNKNLQPQAAPPPKPKAPPPSATPDVAGTNAPAASAPAANASATKPGSTTPALAAKAPAANASSTTNSATPSNNASAGARNAKPPSGTVGSPAVNPATSQGSTAQSAPASAPAAAAPAKPKKAPATEAKPAAPVNPTPAPSSNTTPRNQ